MVPEKPVQTNIGPMSREDVKSLAAVLEGEENDAHVIWNGKEVHVGFGRSVVRHVDLQFAKRNNKGL